MTRHGSQWCALALACVVSACAPAIRPLTGVPAPVTLPRTELPPRPMQLTFDWDYRDDSFAANGDGVARVLPPDRARLDFFLRNGSAGGYAILHEDSIFVPGPDVAKRLLPPVPLLWAALGKLELPAAPDTIARLDGDTLRVDIGTIPDGDIRRAAGRAWRLTYVWNRLVRIDRVDGGRIVEWLSRTSGPTGEAIRYNHQTGRRHLSIVVSDTTWVEGFDELIWRRQQPK